jgi:hypothetical protein
MGLVERVLLYVLTSWQKFGHQKSTPYYTELLSVVHFHTLSCGALSHAVLLLMTTGLTLMFF